MAGLALIPKILACVAAIAGAALAAPFAVAIRDGDNAISWAFGVPMGAGFVAALALIVPWVAKRVKRGRARLAGDEPQRFNAADAAVAVGAVWVGLGIFGAIPLRLSGAFKSIVDAVFESVSGFTTTGATVLADVESLPRAVNLWRCETHWLGGMGVIVLVVALMPLLGIGGSRLISAETTGPEKGKLTSRVADTAKALWAIYAGLTLLETLLLRLCGMDWFNAVCHAFSTLGTGGFSTRNASVGAFGSAAAEWVCTAFMFAAAVNFAIYHRLLMRRDWSALRGTEFKAFCRLACCAVAAIFAVLLFTRTAPFWKALRLAAFQVASLVSTTGFCSDDYDTWAPAAKVVLLLLCFTGGSSGSTAGGPKIIRWAILAKQTGCELERVLHPRAVFTSRIDGRPVRDGFLGMVGAFLFAYLALVAATAIAGAIAGLPLLESFTAALSMVGNIGPAFGKLGPAGNYGDLPAALKMWYCVAMVAGRLEIFTLLALCGRLVSLLRDSSRRSTTQLPTTHD